MFPAGRPIYNGLGYLTTRTSKRRLVGKLQHLLPFGSEGWELTPAGGTILDFGTAWHHHDAFLLYLIGDYKIYLFDIQDRAWLSYIKTYLQYLIEHLDFSRLRALHRTQRCKKLDYLLNSRPDDVYKACNFDSIVTDVTDKPFLPERSLDFVVSNCVLSHIPPSILRPECWHFVPC